MANIQLTQELVKSLFDYKDGFLYWKVKPSRSTKIGDLAGCLFENKGEFRYKVSIKNKPYYSSRIIFLWHNGWLPINVDHENHITTDDSIENLRASTESQNTRNRTSAKGSSSIYLGVTFHKRDKYWQSQILDNGKRHYLGSFKSESKAALAYNKAAVMHHGEFANLNIIMGGE